MLVPWQLNLLPAGTLALAVVGGLSISMLLTLFVLPCLYLIVNRLAERLKSWLTGRASPW
ncbi:hypothetical protein ACR80S_15200 [Halomonas sp. MA07-2]|uniref:hypothetical protein n=1 Tax=unclassified Halomonas TaxID=2609666 RepID=UPI003EEBFBCD